MGQLKPWPVKVKCTSTNIPTCLRSHFYFMIKNLLIRLLEKINRILLFSRRKVHSLEWKQKLKETFVPFICIIEVFTFVIIVWQGTVLTRKIHWQNSHFYPRHWVRWIPSMKQSNVPLNFSLSNNHLICVPEKKKHCLFHKRKTAVPELKNKNIKRPIFTLLCKFGVTNSVNIDWQGTVLTRNTHQRNFNLHSGHLVRWSPSMQRLNLSLNFFVLILVLSPNSRSRKKKNTASFTRGIMQLTPFVLHILDHKKKDWEKTKTPSLLKRWFTP